MIKKTRKEMTETIVNEVDDWDLETLISVMKYVRAKECEEASLKLLCEWYKDTKLGDSSDD